MNFPLLCLHFVSLVALLTSLSSNDYERGIERGYNEMMQDVSGGLATAVIVGCQQLLTGFNYIETITFFE